MLRRLLPVAGLFVLSPLVGEYLLGNVSITELPALPILAPMYGGGALLVREIARRTGRGWPAILLLAAAYGVIEAALIDQMLFNPPDLPNGPDLTAAYIPALGFSAANALAFVGGHMIWSIGVPIALVETFTPDRRTTPWLGRIGLAVVAIIYVAGSFLIFRFIHQESGFLGILLPPAKLIGAAVVALALIVAAFAIPRRRAKLDRPAPRPWLVGVLSFAVFSAYVMRPDSWAGVAIGLAVLAVVAGTVARWSRREGWNARHRLALAGGALLTYAWLGFLLNDLYGREPSTYIPGQAALTAGAILLLVAAGAVVRAKSRAAAEIV